MALNRPFSAAGRVTGLLGNLLLATTATLAALLLAEGAARWLAAEPVYRSVDGVYPGFQRGLKSRYYVRDAQLGFAPGPGWRSAEGRRGFQNGAEYEFVEGSAVDIILLGDSVIQSRLLEQAMKGLLAHVAVRVWNAGIGGYNTLQEAYYLEHHTRLEPEVIVLGFCLNDFLPSMTVVRDHSRTNTMMQNLFEPIGHVNPFWFRHSALYRMIKLRALPALGGRNLWSADTVVRNRALVREGLGRIRGYAAAHNATLLVVVYPHLTVDDDYLRAAHETVLQVLAELGIAGIDLRAVYHDRGYDMQQLRFAPDDVVHPNAQGHLLAAAEVVKSIAPRLGMTKGDAERIAASAQ